MTTPAAYLGLAPAFAPQRVARVCMDCSDKAAAEALARAMNCDGITHGLCETCGARRLAEILSLSEQHGALRPAASGELPPSAAAYANTPANTRAARTATAPAVI